MQQRSPDAPEPAPARRQGPILIYDPPKRALWSQLVQEPSRESRIQDKMGLLRGCPLLLLVAACLLGGCSGSSWHSLRFLSTSIWEPDQGEPDFIGVAYLDDQLGGQFNSTMRKAVPQVPWLRKLVQEEPQILDWHTKEAMHNEQGMKNYLMYQIQLHNISRGLQTWQHLVSCEISNDGHKRGFNQFAYNGEDYLSFDKETLTWTATTMSAQVTKRKWDADGEDVQFLKTFLEEECIWWLQKFLHHGKESLLRREAPVTKVTRKEDYDGLETLVCRAHGFYPKEIDATWRKDGEVWEQETFRGGIIPNMDGTYHTWLSIRIHPEDRDRYRCHVEHDSLPEPLDVAWEESASWKIEHIAGALVGVLASVLLVAGVMFYIWKRRRGYQATHTAQPGGGQET